jgi:hypothetical protein
MRCTILLLVVILLVAALLSGCGLITSRLPRIKIEPPPAQQQTTPSEPPTESTQAPPDSVVGGARAVEETKPSDTDSGPEVQPQEPEAQAPTGTTKPAAPAPVKPTVAKPVAPKPTQSSTHRARYVPLGAARALTSGDLAGRSAWELDILRNEIYAAHGRPFARADLRRYFRAQWWYHEDPSFSEARLSALEKRNADFIARYQKTRGKAGRTTPSGGRATGASGGFVLPFSSRRQVTASDLRGLSRWQLDVARNEIYARHGRPFKRSDLRNYFRGQSWYHEDPSFTESRLSALEKRNAEFIRQNQ